jgi:hypothetical protein
MQEADLMYWRLLRIKASDKAYIPFTSDSAAIAVMHYYEDGGDRALLPTAYYYAGTDNLPKGIYVRDGKKFVVK